MSATADFVVPNRALQRYILADEKIIIATHRHWSMLWEPLLTTAGAFVLALALLVAVDPNVRNDMGWVWIPFVMILLLAGLQALPKDLLEAAKVDGATPWQSFWNITFPLMLPVSVTAIVIRIIFQLKLADIVINVTAGGPGGATDTVSSFIFREYRDRSNVGYGTMLAEFYLILIIIFVLLLLNVISRWMRKVS